MQPWTKRRIILHERLMLPVDFFTVRGENPRPRESGVHPILAWVSGGKWHCLAPCMPPAGRGNIIARLHSWHSGSQTDLSFACLIRLPSSLWWAFLSALIPIRCADAQLTGSRPRRPLRQPQPTNCRSRDHGK